MILPKRRVAHGDEVAGTFGQFSCSSGTVLAHGWSEKKPEIGFSQEIGSALRQHTRSAICDTRLGD
jgi:hypothetical protein